MSFSGLDFLISPFSNILDDFVNISLSLERELKNKIKEIEEKISRLSDEGLVEEQTDYLKRLRSVENCRGLLHKIYLKNFIDIDAERSDLEKANQNPHLDFFFTYIALIKLYKKTIRKLINSENVSSQSLDRYLISKQCITTTHLYHKICTEMLLASDEEINALIEIFELNPRDMQMLFLYLKIQRCF